MSRKGHKHLHHAAYSGEDVRKLVAAVPKKFWKLVRSRRGEVIHVWIVDGFFIREGDETHQSLDVGWVGGGHDLIDKYIPWLTIWIESVFNTKDKLAFLVHELHERDLMEAGLDYEKAHPDANVVEAMMRATRHPNRPFKPSVRSEGDL